METHPTGEWNAQEYLENVSFFSTEKGIELLNQYQFSPSDQILDLGCGAGNIAAFMAQQVPHGKVIGIDISSDMIDHAKRNYTTNNVSFKCKDARAINYKSKFNLIFANGLIFWLKEQDHLFSLISQALLPGGTFLFSTSTNPQPFLQALATTMNQKKWVAYFKSYEIQAFPIPKPKLEEFAQSHGFVITYIEPYLEDIPFDSKEKYLSFLDILPFGQDQVPQSLRKKYLEEIVENYLMITDQMQHATIHHYCSFLFVKMVKI